MLAELPSISRMHAAMIRLSTTPKIPVPQPSSRQDLPGLQKQAVSAHHSATLGPTCHSQNRVACGSGYSNHYSTSRAAGWDQWMPCTFKPRTFKPRRVAEAVLSEAEPRGPLVTPCGALQHVAGHVQRDGVHLQAAFVGRLRVRCGLLQGYRAICEGFGAP